MLTRSAVLPGRGRGAALRSRRRTAACRPATVEPDDQAVRAGVGNTLFDRNTRSVRLTSSGPGADGSGARRCSTRCAEPRPRCAPPIDGEVGTVRIAFAGVSTHRLVARLARAVRSQRPGIQLELSSQNFAQPAMKRLLAGETDLALGRWDVVPAERRPRRIVMRDSLVVAVPDTHAPRRRSAAVDLASCRRRASSHCPRTKGRCCRIGCGASPSQTASSPNVVQVAPDTQTALALVSAQVGCHLTLGVGGAQRQRPARGVRPARRVDALRTCTCAPRGDADDHNPALRAVLDILLGR